jgi:hypothetical protein
VTLSVLGEPEALADVRLVSFAGERRRTPNDLHDAESHSATRSGAAEGMDLGQEWGDSVPFDLEVVAALEVDPEPLPRIGDCSTS